jgi:hypothetical protein
MSDQPEALRLADWIESEAPPTDDATCADVAAELRRLQSRAEVQDAALTCLRLDFRQCALRAEKAEAEVERLRGANQELLAALRGLIDWFDDETKTPRPAPLKKARATINKAEENK